MKSLSAQKQDHVIFLLRSGKSIREISTQTGHGVATISRIHSKHCPDIPKTSGGHPSKLSPVNIHHAAYLITSQKVENAVQVTKALKDITNQPLSSETTRRHLKDFGLKAVVKKKKPTFTTKHRRERMDFAISHKDWTMEDWKKVIW